MPAGRPSPYNEKTAATICRQARKAASMGATNEDLAELFDVSVSTIGEWIAKHKEFSDVLKDAKAERDAQVERRLYERAMGYSHPAVKIFCGKDGAVTEVPYTEHYPPDVTACIFWLKNRKPTEWRDVRDVNVNREQTIEKLTLEQLYAIASGARDPAQEEGSGKSDRVH